MPFLTFLGRKSCALGHFGPVGPGGQRGLPGRAIRGLLHLEANSGRKFLNGDEYDDDFGFQPAHQQHQRHNRGGGTQPRYCHLGGSVLSVVDR
jgi:hypothetical protein